MEQINYIYLLREREFVNTKENIYKIGRSKQENTKRFLQYPKGSQLILQESCSDCLTLETALINEFKNHFIHRTDLGNEYFEGNISKMRHCIWEFVAIQVCKGNEYIENIEKTRNEIKSKQIMNNIIEGVIENEYLKQVEKNIENSIMNDIENFQRDKENFEKEKEIFEYKQNIFQKNFENFKKEFQHNREEMECYRKEMKVYRSNNDKIIEKLKILIEKDII